MGENIEVALAVLKEQLANLITAQSHIRKEIREIQESLKTADSRIADLVDNRYARNAGNIRELESRVHELNADYQAFKKVASVGGFVALAALGTLVTIAVSKIFHN